jgi:pimeloyl-ACP methyl ester carboxylesterase
VEKVKSKDGTLIAYARTGAGPALVLVHGSTADHTRWAPVLPMLEKYFTLYALDRRGRGGSGDSAAYSIEREYEDIAAVANSIREPVNLLGHSYGALCTLEAALLVPNLNKLILYEPVIRLGQPLYPAGIRAKIEEALGSGDREKVLLILFRDIVEMPEHEINQMRKEPVWEARLAAAHTVPREFADDDYILEPSRFKNMKAPTMMLQGGDSPETIKAMTGAINAALPNRRIVVMPGQQHAAISTAPEMFARLVTEFLMESSGKLKS